MAQEVADALVNNFEVKIDLKVTNFSVGYTPGSNAQNLGENRKQSIIQYFNELVYQGTNISK